MEQLIPSTDLSTWAKDVLFKIANTVCMNCSQQKISIISHWKAMLGHVEADIICSNCGIQSKWHIELGYPTYGSPNGIDYAKALNDRMV